MRVNSISKGRRPVFFNLWQIALPVGAWTSIGHRVTGVCLAIIVPFSLYLLDLSLRDANDYARVMTMMHHPIVRFGMIGLTWVFAHHLLAGVRHLLTDIDVGSHLPVARKSAWAVNIGGLGIAAMSSFIWL